MNLNKLPILLYDSECTMCKRFQQGVERLDLNNQINYISIHSKEIYRKFPELSYEKCQQTVHLITQDHQILKGSEVVEFLIKITPGVKKFSWLLESDQGKKAIDFFYNKVNQLKQSRMGCSSCKK